MKLTDEQLKNLEQLRELALDGAVVKDVLDEVLPAIYAYKSQVEEMQKIIDTAVMFLQSNELNIKAEQIKAMSQSLKGDKP